MTLFLEMVDLSQAHSSLLSALHAECFSDQWNAKSFQDLLNTPAISGVLAVQAKTQTPTGFLLIQSLGEEGAEIVLIATRPEFQRQGVARQLLDAIPARTGHVFLEVSEDNRPAIEFYKKTGFEEVGRRKNYYKRDNATRTDALIMKKAL